MSWNLQQPITSELAAAKANKDGTDFTNPATWRSGLDVVSTNETRRQGTMDYAAVAFDGATTSTRIVSPCQALGTGDFSLWSRFRVPATTPLNQPVVIALSDSGSSAGTDSVYLSFENADLRFTKFGASSSDARRATISGVVTAYAGQVVDIVVTRTGTTLKIYINGTDTTYTETTAGTPPAWSSSVNSSFVIVGARSSTTIFPGRIYRSVVFNRALSASDVAELITVGVNPADQWGSQTAAYTSDFSVGVDGWNANNGTAAGNIDGIGGQDNNLRYTIGSTNNTVDGLNRNLTVITSKRYRLNFAYYIPSGQTLITSLRALVGLTEVASGLNVTNAWTDVSVEGVASGDTLLRVYKNFSTTGNLTDVFYIRAVTATRIGAIVDLDLSVGIGLFFPDRSDNRLGGDGFGGISHSMPREYGQITVVKELIHSDISSSLGTTLLFQLPPNCGIAHVEFDRVTAMDAGVTLEVGTAATGTKFAAATAASATGIIGAASASMTSESNSANTPIYLRKSGATSVGRVRVRVTYSIRG